MFRILYIIPLLAQVLTENSIEMNTNLISDENQSDNKTISANISSSPEKPETSMLPTIDHHLEKQHISKAIELDRNESVMKNFKENDEFRPSPEVKDVVYERNMFPVVPAYPEAKYSNYREDEQRRKPNLPWERPDEQQSWISPVGFKFPQNNIQTSKDRPYQFETGRTFDGFTGKNGYGATAHKPQINLGEKIPVSSSGSGTGIGSWDIVGTLHPDLKYLPKKPSGYGYDFGGYMEKPPTEVEHHINYQYPVKKNDNPWKKIIKIIAAFIPIGLLISALTPTIITVSPMNNTMMRSRNDDPHSATIKKLVASLGYFDHLNDRDCENRILCELLLSASSSQNAERHIENFLANFTDREKYSSQRVEELKKIFEAVKRQQCETITCKGIKENT